MALRALPRRRLLLPPLLPRCKPLSFSPIPLPHHIGEIHHLIQPKEPPSTMDDLHFPKPSSFLTADALVSCLPRQFIRSFPKNRLARLLQELGGLGLPDGDIKKAVRHDAMAILSMEGGELPRLVAFLDELRCREAVKKLVLANGVLRAAVAVKRRVECLHKLGLTRPDALKVLAAEPRAVVYDLKDVERKVEFLVQRMGFRVEWLVEYPEFLGVNLEKWIVPRHNVIEHLRSICALRDPVEMKHYVGFSRSRFYNMFVKPYPECKKMFGGLVRVNEARPRHPAGLWKLFKPAKYASTEEDVKNMKLFMESLH